MPESIEAIAGSLLAIPAPILLPDTCSLLNIIEVPVPEEKVSPNVLPAALEFLAGVRSRPPRVSIVLAQVVEEEWLRLHKEKCDKAAASIRQVDVRIAFLWGIASSLSAAPTAPFIQFAGLQIAPRAHDVAEQLVRSAKIIQSDDTFHAAAGVRIFAGHAPAAAGRPEINDCVLVEQYLALCKLLRGSDFAERCIFVSSNVRDFGEPKAPRPPLDRQFREVGIDFAYDFAAAAALLR